jgi:hypothetical protein
MSSALSPSTVLRLIGEHAVVHGEHRLGSVVRDTRRRPPMFAHICVGAVLVHTPTEVNPQYPAVAGGEQRAHSWPGGLCWRTKPDHAVPT